MPGAARVAGRITRLADEIDEVVAGQLWVQICEHDPDDDKYVAKKILDRVYRESMAELGVGDLAKRRDEAWAMTVPVDAFAEPSRPDPRTTRWRAGRYSPISSSAGSTRASWSRAIATFFCSTSPMQLSRSKRWAAEAEVG